MVSDHDGRSGMRFGKPAFEPRGVDGEPHRGVIGT